MSVSFLILKNFCTFYIVIQIVFIVAWSWSCVIMINFEKLISRTC